MFRVTGFSFFQDFGGLVLSGFRAWALEEV